MSVFDLPRLHFAGTAVTRLPTGPRCGLYDLARGRAVTAEGLPFAVDEPRKYRDYLDTLGERFDPDGRISPVGRFGRVKGWNFGGNGHFWVNALITGCERTPGTIDTSEAAVGRQVDMWGHCNEYLATTHNRARVLDIDPASNWTTTLMVGQFGFGRQGRSHEVGYMASGGVRGLQPPRRQNSRHVLDVGDHPLADWFRRSVVYQFVVDSEDGLNWFEETKASETAVLLRARVREAGFAGLVVRFSLTGMATPQAHDAPDIWQLHGTVAPWRRGEERTCPAGRLLGARGPRRPGTGTPLHDATVHVTAEHTVLDLLTSVPAVGRGPEPPDGRRGHPLGPRLDVGELEVRTRDSGRLVARVPSDSWREDMDRTGGLVTVATEPGVAARLALGEKLDEPLVLVGELPGQPRPAVLLAEEETVVRVDDSALFLEPSDMDPGDGSAAAVVRIRTRRLGRPAPVAGLRVMQYFNPRALPGDARANEDARSGDVRIVDLNSGRSEGGWAEQCTVSTDAEGHGAFAVRWASPGTTRLLLLPPGDTLPCDPREPGSAARAYDNDDLLGYWPSVCAVDVRALPDTRHLDGIPRDQVTFEVLYREVFAPYELLYSFMDDEVFSLADRGRVATYARLIWLMCDPANRDKTYYMPPTRDMTGPQARLLLAYLRQDEAGRRLPPRTVPRRRCEGVITTRAQLHDALREAATLELAVMLQYLYAGWSIPRYGAGRELVRRGEWSPRQLRLVCGDGGESIGSGMRDTVMSVAREEMTHFLVVNNIITAMGMPFHLPPVDFGTLNSRLRVPLDLCLEGFGLGSVQRFVALEQPGETTRDFVVDTAIAPDVAWPYPYQSLSDLYAAIREGIATIPDLFMVRRGRGGGEHHLFMRKSVNSRHPDYQLEVDDVASALFAVDFVTEHGEGHVLQGAEHGEDSHYDTFLRISDLLMDEYREAEGTGGERRSPPWSPAYPVLRNPSLHAGNPARTQVTASEARAAMLVFNHAYLLMNQLMIQHFGTAADASLRRSRLMNAAIDVMTGLMRPLAELLVTLPSGLPGRTAGPSFELEEEPGVIPRPDVAARVFSLRFSHLADMAAELPGLPAQVSELARGYAEQFERDGATGP